MRRLDRVQDADAACAEPFFPRRSQARLQVVDTAEGDDKVELVCCQPLPSHLRRERRADAATAAVGAALDQTPSGQVLFEHVCQLLRDALTRFAAVARIECMLLHLPLFWVPETDGDDELALAFVAADSEVLRAAFHDAQGEALHLPLVPDADRALDRVDTGARSDDFYVPLFLLLLRQPRPPC